MNVQQPQPLRLSNGVLMPPVALGTWQMPNDASLESAVCTALQLGYRLIDTAQIYANAPAIGRAIRKSGLPREELFLTSKIWGSHATQDGVMEAFEQMLEQLQTDYLDLLLIHWPNAQGEPMVWQSQNAGCWRALEQLYRQKAVRAIGVANFLPHHLVPLLSRATIAPMVNQLECHPGYTQFGAVNFSFNHGIAVQSWSPLGRGILLRHPTIMAMAERYRVTPAQLLLRWCLEHGVMPVTRTKLIQHQKENLDIFGFTIAPEDMETLDKLPATAHSGLHPDSVTF